MAPPCKTWEGKYNYNYVEYCYGQFNGKLDSDLIDFIIRDSPPVYIGFGSVHIKNPQKFTDMLFTADKKKQKPCGTRTGMGGIRKWIPAG